MYKSTCDNCGAPTFPKYKTGAKMFCSRACYHESLQEKRKPGEVTRYIHPAGYTNLVCAIVKRAREDIMHYHPGTSLRVDAEHFFESGYFENITGMDGRTILANIHAEYDRRHRKGARPR